MSEHTLSRRDIFRLALAGSGAVLACNLPNLIKVGSKTGERNLGTEPSPQPTTTLSPDFKIEGDTPEEMLKNFFEQVLGVTPIDVNGTLQFQRLTDGSVLHVDGFDSQECVEGYDVDRINLYLKGDACVAQPTQTQESAPSSPTKGHNPPKEPTRTKEPPEVPDNTVTPARTQPPQPTRTPGGDGATPIVDTPVNTPKPPEPVDPTTPPQSEPSSTPSF